jgi:hypothetical protein
MDNSVSPIVNQSKLVFINQMAYPAMLMVALDFLSLKDWFQATILSGLALFLDSFDAILTFKKRPLWQRTWLIVHTIAVFILFSILIFSSLI